MVLQTYKVLITSFLNLFFRIPQTQLYRHLFLYTRTHTHTRTLSLSLCKMSRVISLCLIKQKFCVWQTSE